MQSSSNAVVSQFSALQSKSNRFKRSKNTCHKLLCVLVSPALKVGQYLISKVEDVKNEGRLARLSVSTPAQACAESEQGWNLTNLMPGLLVKATIKKVETRLLFW